MGREHVVEVVGLEVVLEAAVACSGGEQQVHAVPEEVKRGTEEGEVGQDAGVVVQMFNGMHGETGEGFDVSVAVVQRVHEGEEWLAV